MCIRDRITDRQLGFFWRPEEVDILRDANDFDQLTESEQHIFTSNLKRQIVLDSVQGRCPNIAFLPLCSLPEVETWIETWSFFETIHSRSYTHIMKNVYPDPTEVFDTILDDKEILKRAKSVTYEYDKFGKMALDFQVGKKVDMLELKKQLYLAMNTVNLLEGLRFYISFACTFGFGELRLMEGSAKIISLIARDESQHLAITQHIIKNYQTKEKDKVMLKVMKDCKQEVYDMYAKAVDEEKQWAEYLMKDGSMIGLSATLLSNYVEFIANKRLRGIGLEPLYDISSRTNPLPWTQHWLSSRGLQNAPQETEIESYIIGGIKQDIKDDTFEEFKL